MRTNENEITPTLFLLDERACACQKSLVFLRQAYPNSALMTYDNTQARGAEHVLLAKFVMGIGEKEPQWLTYQECTEETTADNIPGGLRGDVKPVAGQPFQVFWYPMLSDGRSPVWEGGAILHIHSETSQKFWLKFGNGNIAFMHFSPNENMAGPQIDCAQGNAVLEDDCVMIRRRERSVVTAVRGDFEQVWIESLPEASEGLGTYAVAACTGTDIYVTAAFSEDPARARLLAGCDPVAEEARVHQYYEDLLAHWQLDTPDPVLNEAFSHALLNVEYAWLYPYGWIESLQHWPTMWHMEHTAAEEWNGRYERVRCCLRSQMKNVFPNGAIPDMCPDGTGRRDWGGNNQFFFREVEHYVKMTGDIAFAAEAEPYLEKALQQTFAEYDPTGSGVIGWNTQIGNQEDFESTPGKGAATGIEGVRMLEIMSYIKNLLGKPEEADAYAARAAWCKKEWYDCLWQKDLSRPAWYEDIHGIRRLETTYHGIIYPILYNAIDDADKVSGLDHLRHRLTGPEGEIYQSNHFGDHAYETVPTWGMQCGSDMQPFATAAYAACGMKKEAVEPLTFIARRVCGSYQRGSWPETANEKRFAYFSPSAAVFSQGIIESVFGLKRDRIANVTTITPAIPEDWPNASLRLPKARLSYTTLKCGFTLRIQLEDDTLKRVRVLCPPAFSVTVQTASGSSTVAAIQHCGWSSAEFDLGYDRDITASFTWEPMEIRCSSTALAACGDSWSVSVSGDAALVGIEDRCGVLSDLEWKQGGLTAKLRPDLLKPYEPYGWYGRINFARRMVYLRLRVKEETFLYPCPVTVLPPYYCTARLQEKEILLTFYNQTEQAVRGGFRLLYGKTCLTADGIIPPRQHGQLHFSTSGISPENAGFVFSPGTNRALLAGPVQCTVEIEAEAKDAAVIPIPLDPAALKPAEYWRSIGLFSSHGHMMQGPDFFMKDLFAQYHEIPILPQVPLYLNPAGFLPFSREKHPIVTIPLNGRKIKKLYLLCSAFIDNHNVFSNVLHIEAEAEKKDSYLRPVFNYDCAYPGTLDMGFGNDVIAGFATFVNGTPYHQVPALPLSEGETDYPDTQPPAYPQRTLWRTGRAIDCCNTVLNLLELDFGEFREMKEIRIIPAEADAAGGIFALAAHVAE